MGNSDGSYQTSERVRDLAARVAELEVTLSEILGYGCCDDVRPKALARWREVLSGDQS